MPTSAMGVLRNIMLEDLGQMATVFENCLSQNFLASLLLRPPLVVHQVVYV